MRVNTTTVIADADAIIALLFKFDSNHARAKEISAFLSEKDANVIYPRTTIVEVVTTLQRKFSNTVVAHEVATFFSTHPDMVADPTPEIYSLAVKEYFSLKGSKKNTLFDAIVAATAKVYNADAIFSFDKFYKLKGFRLAVELLANSE